MRELKTRFGTLYIEEPTDNRADKDRYVIYDSEYHWFDYFTVECVEETWDDYETFYKEITERFANYESLEKLLDDLGINYDSIEKDWTKTIPFLYGCFYYEKDDCFYTKYEDKYDSEITKDNIIENEWINKIGDYYILIRE